MMLVYVTYHCPKKGFRSLFETSSKFRMGHSKFHSKFVRSFTYFFTKHCKIHGFVYFKLRMKLRMAHSKFRRSFEQTSKAFFWTMIRDINQHHELLKSLSVSDRKSFKCLSKQGRFCETDGTCSVSFKNYARVFLKNLFAVLCRAD